MSIQEIQREMTQIKDVLSALQVAIERLSSKLELTDDRQISKVNASQDSINWLALEGVGADMWKKIDVNAYLDEERNAWN